MQSTNLGNEIVDLKTFYLVCSLYQTSLTQTEIPAEVSNLYKEYLEAGKTDRVAANQNLINPILPAYSALKLLIEGEGWAAKY